MSKFPPALAVVWFASSLAIAMAWQRPAQAECAEQCHEGRCWKLAEFCFRYSDTHAMSFPHSLTGGGTLFSSGMSTTRYTENSCLKECPETNSRAHTIPPPSGDGSTCSENATMGTSVSRGYCASS